MPVKDAEGEYQKLAGKHGNAVGLVDQQRKRKKSRAEKEMDCAVTVRKPSVPWSSGIGLPQTCTVSGMTTLWLAHHSKPLAEL
jgi:hypothetical protein